MKKIRKTYSGVVPNGKVLNSKNNSLQDTYSSDYLNRAIPNTNDLGEIIVDDISCKNLFNKNTVIHGYWINNGVLEANALWDTSDYIEVKPNTTYSYSSALISGKSEIQTTLIYYDADKNRISSSYFQTLTKTEATPSNCYYVRILYRNDVQENIQFEKGSVVTDYVEHKDFENKEIYSTSEQVIGTWIDGKPLYRKVFIANVDSDMETDSKVITNIGNVRTKRYESFFANNDNPGAVEGGTRFSDTDQVWCYITTGGEIKARVYGSTYVGRTLIVIVEYTKTTD